MARCVATRFCLPPSQYGGENRGRVYFEGKMVFPHPVCQEEAVFLKLNGLQHYYRIRHLAALSMAKNYRRNHL